VTVLPTEALSAPAEPQVRPRTRRAPVVAVLLAVGAVLLVVVIALVARRPTTGARAPYDARSVQPNGTHALTQLLLDRGVDVSFGDTGDARSTVVVLAGDLDAAGYRRLTGSGARLVLLGDGGVTGLDQVDRIVRTRSPGCDLPVAVNAGTARAGSAGFAGPKVSKPGTATITASCYDGSLVALSISSSAGSGDGQVTLLGDGSFLTNEYLAKDGNAALALGLFGGRSKLVWYQPSSPVGGGESLTSLLPSRVPLAALQLVIGVVALAVWRGRRLGPVVEEPLPVVVRGAETVEGRARLYRAGRARGTAAAALRAAAQRRLSARLSLGRDPSPQAIVHAVATRTGWRAESVGALLYGAVSAGPAGPAGPAGRPAHHLIPESIDIPDDATLVRLVDDLDALEKEVRTL